MALVIGTGLKYNLTQIKMAIMQSIYLPALIVSIHQVNPRVAAKPMATRAPFLQIHRQP